MNHIPATNPVRASDAEVSEIAKQVEIATGEAIHKRIGQFNEVASGALSAPAPYPRQIDGDRMKLLAITRAICRLSKLMPTRITS